MNAQSMFKWSALRRHFACAYRKCHVASRTRKKKFRRIFVIFPVNSCQSPIETQLCFKTSKNQGFSQTEHRALAGSTEMFWETETFWDHVSRDSIVASRSKTKWKYLRKMHHIAFFPCRRPPPPPSYVEKVPETLLKEEPHQSWLIWGSHSLRIYLRVWNGMYFDFVHLLWGGK